MVQYQSKVLYYNYYCNKNKVGYVMRARKKKHGAERLEAVSDYFVTKPILSAERKTYLENQKLLPLLQ